MAEELPESERKLLVLLPMLSSWIQNDRNLTDKEITAFFRQFKGLMPLRFNAGMNAMLEMASRYKGHRIYGKDVEVILSARGRKWLEEFNKRAGALIQHH